MGKGGVLLAGCSDKCPIRKCAHYLAFCPLRADTEFLQYRLGVLTRRRRGPSDGTRKAWRQWTGQEAEFGLAEPRHARCHHFARAQLRVIVDLAGPHKLPAINVECTQTRDPRSSGRGSEYMRQCRDRTSAFVPCRRWISAQRVRADKFTQRAPGGRTDSAKHHISAILCLITTITGCAAGYPRRASNLLAMAFLAAGNAVAGRKQCGGSLQH